VVALVTGCEQPRTELVVRVETELAWGAGQWVQSVVLTVRREGATGPLRSARTTALGAGGERRALPLLVGVTAGDDTDTPVWIEALGCGDLNGCTAATAVVAQRAVVRFTQEETQEVTLLLASACVGVTCGSEQRCAVDSGRCENATRAQATVRPFIGIDASSVIDVTAQGDVTAIADSTPSDATPWSGPDSGVDDLGTASWDVPFDLSSGEMDARVDSTTTGADVLPTTDLGAQALDATDTAVAMDVPVATDVGASDLGGLDAGPRDSTVIDMGTPDTSPLPCSGATCLCSSMASAGWCSIGATCVSGACSAGPAMGALVITEIMNDPDMAGDLQGEWFEVYNRSATPVDLRGMRVRGSGTEMFEVTGSGPLLVPGRGYAVLGKNGDMVTNGGVTMLFAYGSAMDLSNSTSSPDSLTLLASDGSTVIDSVSYANTIASGWPVISGRSKSLRPTILDATMNDTSSAWCPGGPAFGRGDFGTPGAANVCQ